LCAKIDSLILKQETRENPLGSICQFMTVFLLIDKRKQNLGN
jgi:hypothetical protein